MAFLPENERFPYQEDKITSRDHQDLADYLKRLVTRLQDIYAQIADAVNQTSAGDMTKAVYDTDNNGIVDNSEKLEGSTKTQVQAHDHSVLTGVLSDQHHAQLHAAAHQSGGGDEISVAGLLGVLGTKQDADKLQARAVDSGAPTDGDVLTWDNALSKWKPAAAGGGNPGEGHIVLFPWNYDSIGQGTWVFNHVLAYVYATVWYNSPPANLDNYTLKAYLAAGTYTLVMYGDKDTNRGIVDIDIDGVEVASWDQYNGSSIPDARFVQTSISISSGGIKSIKVRVDGKNASSSDYYCLLSSLTFYRTA